MIVLQQQGCCNFIFRYCKKDELMMTSLLLMMMITITITIMIFVIMIVMIMMIMMIMLIMMLIMMVAVVGILMMTTTLLLVVEQITPATYNSNYFVNKLTLIRTLFFEFFA